MVKNITDFLNEQIFTGYFLQYQLSYLILAI